MDPPASVQIIWGITFLCSSDGDVCAVLDYAGLGRARFSLAINSTEQFPVLTVLAGLHQGTCCRGRGVGCLLPGYRLIQYAHMYTHTHLCAVRSKASRRQRFSCLFIPQSQICEKKSRMQMNVVMFSYVLPFPRNDCLKSDS